MNVLFLGVRIAHVLLAALWLGSAAFMSLLLMPAINASGPSGGQVMLALNRKGIVPFFASISGITVLTGFYLYGRFTGGFDPGVSGSMAGRVYGMGGVAGILAAVVGGSIVGRSSKKMIELMGRVATMADGADKQRLLGDANALRQKMATFGLVVVVLQVIAAALMAIGHYV